MNVIYIINIYNICKQQSSKKCDSKVSLDKSQTESSIV